MIRRKILSACFSCLLVSIAAVKEGAQVPMNPADGVYGKGEWKYQSFVLGRGTSEEKAVGKLSFKGKEVVGNRDDRIRTVLGEFMWSGNECEQSRLGWYRINPQKKYPRWQRVKIDASRTTGPVWTTIKE